MTKKRDRDRDIARPGAREGHRPLLGPLGAVALRGLPEWELFEAPIG